jgi:hypothetical protein
MSSDLDKIKNAVFNNPIFQSEGYLKFLTKYKLDTPRIRLTYIDRVSLGLSQHPNKTLEDYNLKDEDLNNIIEFMKDRNKNKNDDPDNMIAFHHIITEIEKIIEEIIETRRKARESASKGGGKRKTKKSKKTKSKKSVRKH